MEKVFTNLEHARWLREQAKCKRPYWYGTYYLKCTETLLNKKKRQYPSHYTEKRMPTYRKHIADGQICGDCVNGAIKGAIWSELGKREPVYKSHGCPDTNADGMFEYCKRAGMDWGAISTMPDEIGLAVRMGGHVGVYVGNGEVAEWRGFAYGCVITKLTARKWLHWYRLPWTEYVSATDEKESSLLGARLLKRGCEGADVKELQEQLMELGYKLPQYGADGDFGKETENALKRFQRSQNLNPDGKYGDKTHAALMSVLAESDGDEDDGDADGREVIVTGGSVYIRKGAGTAHSIVTVAHKGDNFLCVATASNGWHCVEVNGQNGWISSKYSKIKE